MNFSAMNKQRKYVLTSAAIGFVAMFLPWISVSMIGYSHSVNGMHGKGILVFLCFAGCALLAYLGDQTKNLEKNSWMITLVAAAFALLMMLWFYSQLSGMGSSLLGYGFYIAALAAIGVLLSAWLFRAPSDNLKDSFDSLKKNIEGRLANTGSTPPTTTPPTPPPPTTPPPSSTPPTMQTEPDEPQNPGV